MQIILGTLSIDSIEFVETIVECLYCKFFAIT
jgi:hypothetical protein